MFFLFNKTYIDFDFNVQDVSDKVVVSSTLGGYAFATSPHELLYTEKSYDDLVNNHFNGNDEDFLSFLASRKNHLRNTSRLRIYVDTEAFNQILVRYLKAIMPGLTNDDVYLLYRFIMLHAKYYNSQLDKYALESRQQYAALELMSKTEFTSSYGSISVPALPAALKDSVGLEFLIGTHLSGSTAFDATLTERATKVCWNFFGGELDEVKLSLLSELFDLTSTFPEVGQLSYETTTLEDVIALKPELAVLADMDSNAIGSDNLRQNYDAQSLIDLWNLVWGRVGTSDDDLSQLLATHLVNGVDIDALLNLDISRGLGSQIFGKGELKEKMNPYIISYLYHLKRNNDTAALARFSL